MKLMTLLVPAILSFGCNGAPRAAPGGGGTATQPKLGSLSLELLGADRAGHPYRLRDATFEIENSYLFIPTEGDAGDTSQTVSSETDPDATNITTRVLPGAYTVTLEPGWFLEKVTAAGGERVSQSVLLSPSTVYTWVYDRGTAEVIYSFGVDGTLIDFRHGDLSIGFDIEHPNEDAGAGLGVDGG
jgi:hypothetical protein